MAGKAAVEDETRREIALIRQLWAFAKTDRYRQVARKNADETWLELHDEAIRMVLLSHIGKEGTASVARALAGRTEEDQTVLQSLRSTNYSFV